MLSTAKLSISRTTTLWIDPCAETHSAAITKHYAILRQATLFPFPLSFLPVLCVLCVLVDWQRSHALPSQILCICRDWWEDVGTDCSTLRCREGASGCDACMSCTPEARSSSSSSSCADRVAGTCCWSLCAHLWTLQPRRAEVSLQRRSFSEGYRVDT